MRRGSDRGAHGAGGWRGVGRAKTSDVVDAVVVVTAVRLAAPVVTDDQTDLRRLADALGAPLVLCTP